MQTSSDRHEYPAHWEADVVLRDGGTARIRPITVDDAERLVSFYEQVSDESKYYRFFAPYPRLSAKDVHRFTHHDFVDRVGLAATVGGEFIATVRYDRIGPDGMPASAPADEAEVAFLVQDAHQGRGVASALLEHIAAVARERGIRRFAAEVLPANSKMIKVFTDAGYQQKRSFEDGVVRLEFGLEPTDRSLAVQRAREQRAEARSVQRLLAPGSVAVVGAGRTPGGVGRGVLANLRAAGFTGRLFAVNRALGEDEKDIDGVPAHRSVTDIGEPVDLAVVAVPAAHVPEVVAECGEHGVQGLVVISAGYAESGPDGRERQRELVRQARTYGMRIIGPNAFGIINTAPDVRLNASLAPEAPRSGRIGLFAQSGAIGIALLSRLHRRGGGVTGVTGVSTFVSSGNRADVSGNDVLQYWYEDPDTDVVLMYLESIGNPRKFTRLARRTAAVKPLVVVQGARHGSAPQGHAVRATELPHTTVSALLRQAGVIRVDTITELVDAGLLLARQPLPAGPRVAILGNSESLGMLTYDACLSEGLRPLRPLDLTTGASAADFHAALSRVLADDTCDAVVVTAIPTLGQTSPGDAALAEALRSAAAANPSKPVLVVHVELGGLAEALSAAASTAPRAGDRAPGTAPRAGDGTPGIEGPAPLPCALPAAAEVRATPETGEATGATTEPPSRLIPAYPAAERAVRALSEAVHYAQWRRDAAEPGRVPAYEDIDEKGTAERIDALLSTGEGRTLGAEEAGALLGRYGIRLRQARPAPTPDEAARAAEAIGYPVALKTTAPHLRHRADLGGVRLDLADEEQLRRAYSELTELFGSPGELRPVVQGMAPRGVDTIVRTVVDPAAGAVLSFGLAGPASQLLGDMAHRLIPATERDAASLVRSIRTAPLLFGWRGSAPVDTDALEELLLRVSRLVDDHPEVVAVSLEPVVVAPHGLSVLGATVRLARPPLRDDLGPRTLPVY
ncbi:MULTISPECIES: bifunctional GNAT family N-acetyltransferase/acetate--CoA ligase family protein [Streptomyces]|uniref:bifunctional acetate--CoA ligase family protein/GNAT family N-acetyltransferase n=3 Tax=Streptomyces scabiei TaxID=1930 RepID=UPI0004E76645|nr:MULTISPECIES: bifunctional GNAT family N-acetyltransferase/acetate--CoA ligase family protein [Streptomyces]MBP5870303.1 GNAT family N-acetyltransferase [Streptomyces sp. LBUM 1485]KFG09618.1 acyl-CoA synthetase [Streptomyces scabiei]MBP5878877.1 GNAT family N-acetyltransferase [Streptomyces sp. LBUM 1477]MBP5902707.1 GNAT family N-acetyltransferase [Streptomyces sp. LBUM 1488]MBP5913687.1 GNAT family N-acetyltransferase [Streptomyces sp. LBUM 1486]